MAVRPQHMHDGGIVERRLRPIYDWLDNGNNKKALQEAEKVLKKSPSLQAARALKALALFRLGKKSQAHALLDELAAEKLSDDTTLQAMTISYRESQQLHKVCELYESAVKVEPLNEELHSHLFMSYVRVGDYRSQQRAAMALYKFAPKNPYYFWAVMSIVLQAKTSEDATKKGILLALAQRMVDNFITENKMEAEQEARLYIMILELQEKWEDILKFIEGPLYSQLVPGSSAQACIPYLKKLGQWRRLNLLCKDLLWDNQDRWDYYIPYFDSVFQLMKDGGSNDESTADDTAEKCHEFICQLVESMSSGKSLRGPYLARLELWKRLSKDGDPMSLMGSGVALCVQYLRVFANKPCAVPDLRQYLGMLPVKERQERSREFLTCLGFDDKSEPETTEDTQRHISCVSAWRLAAPPLPPDECLALAATMRAHYLRSFNKGLLTATLTEFCAIDGYGILAAHHYFFAAAAMRAHYLRSFNKGLLTATLTEFCAIDGYGILAAHHYFFAAMQTKSTAPVVEALCLLELVLSHSPANFHVKLLLVHLYHFLGNAIAADSIYQRLEVKHIQLVSVGWLHAARLPPACAPGRALQLLATTLALYAHHAKDSVEHLTYAYKYGTFEKLVELRAWGERLEACTWGGVVAREKALLSLVAGPAALLHAPARRLPPEPTDNRDLNVIVSFEPPEFQDPNLKERTFDQEISYLRLKDALLSSIALCIECSDGRPLEERKPQYEELKTCIDAFSEAMQKCKEKYSEREKISISTPFPSRIFAFVNAPVPYRELYSETLRMVGDLAMSNAREAHARCEAVTKLVANAPDQLRKHISTDDWLLRETLETLSNYLEFIGIIKCLLGVCNELVLPAGAKKPKKKANQSPDEIKTTELLNKLNETVQNSITFLDETFVKLPQHRYESNLEQEFSKLTIDKQFGICPVETKLQNGRQDMITEVQYLLNSKSQFLKTYIH